MKTTRAILTFTAVAGLLAGIVAGCAHHETTARAPVPGTEAPSGVTSQQNAADQRVVEQLAGARCDHEQTCNNVGTGQKYASRDACLQKVRASTASDLNAYACPRGIDASGLNHCLAAIRAEQCGFSLDTLARENDCRSGALCMK